MRLTKKVLAGAISASMLLAAPPAFGVTSAQSGYSKPGGIVETQIENSGGGGGDNNPGSNVVSTPESTTAARSNPASLPFTGLDLVLVVAAGGLLLGLGLAMRRLTHPTSAV
jgi:hypothetical protein